MTETITVVFTDLVDSTRLLSSLGDEAFDAVRREHFGVLRSVIAEHGGDEVKNLGDGLMAVFRSASDAITAAVAMQVACDRQGRRAGSTTVGLKVGASIGDATPEDGDWFGTPVVEAARLCAMATSGQLLITEMTRMMAGSRSGERFASIGLVDLKGLPDPVSVSEVHWEPAAAEEASPLPSALAETAGFPFAGRGAERTVLLDALAAAVAGSARAVFIAGEPGIGKTRLVSEVARGAHGEGAVVLFGRSEDEIDAPFRPFAEVLDQLIRHAPDELLAAHVEEVGMATATLAPVLVRRTGAPAEASLAGVDAEAGRLRLFHAVADLLRRQAEIAPVVIVLDDLHWADRSSLLLLRHLVTALDDDRVLTLVTYRDTDLDRHHPLANMLADFRRVPGVERVALDGLSQAEVIEYLALAGGHDLEPEGVELGRQLAEVTAGNPFFVGETLRHLAESGAITQREGRWVAGAVTADEVGVPEGVREVVGRRLSALDEQTEALLSVAAVAGAQFDSAVVGAIAGLDEDVVVDGLDVACTRSLVVEDPERFGWYRFAHALVRQTLLEELSTTKRIRLHRSIGQELERVDPARVEEIAFHYLESAAAGTADKAVEFAERAGRQAMERMAIEQAIVWFRRALEAEESLHSDPARRCELLLDLGDARNKAKEHLEARVEHRVAAALARAAGRPDLLARAAYGYLGPMGFWFAMDDVERRPLVDEALEALPPGEYPELRMLLLTKLVSERTFDLDDAVKLELSAEAAAIARTLGDPNARWDGIAYRLNELLGSGRIDECELLLAELEALDDVIDVMRRTGTIYLRTIVMANRGDFGAVEAETERYLRLAEPIGVAEAQMAFGPAAVRASMTGRFDESRRMYEEMRRVHPVDGTLLSAGAGQYWGAWWKADLDQVVAIAEMFPPSAAGFVALYPLRVTEQLVRGDLEASRAAHQEWKPLLAFVPASFREHLAATATYPTWRLGDAEVAEVLVDMLRPTSGLWPTGGPAQSHGPTDLHLGTNLITMGRCSEAEPILRAALESTQRSGAPAWEAVTQFFLALALRELGQADESDAAAGSARRLASSFGMRLILDDLDRSGLVVGGIDSPR